jgi:V/A-type H+-transporting ATPase subunit F
MKRIAAVGDEDFLVGFRLAGVRNTFDTSDDPRAAIEDAMDHDDVGIVVIDEDLMDDVPGHVQDTINESVNPVFVKLGATEGKGLRSKIKRAIGVDLWKGDDS